MTAKTLKVLYPRLWTDVESSIMDDLMMMQSKSLTKRQMKTIAHNAAFEACYEFMRSINRLIGEAGK